MPISQPLLLSRIKRAVFAPAVFAPAVFAPAIGVAVTGFSAHLPSASAASDSTPPVPISMALASQIGFSSPPPTPAWLPMQPSLGYSVSPVKGMWGPHFAPFLEARLRLEMHPSRGFGELPTTDPTAILARLRPGFLWNQGSNLALAQFQGAATAPLESSASVSNKHLDVHQLFYNRSSVGGLGNIRIGRQELSYGNERVIGPANFSQPGRTWDGVRLSYGPRGRTLDAFYTHTVNFQTPQAMFYVSGLWATYTEPHLGELNLYYVHKGNDHGPSLHRNTLGTLWRWEPSTGYTSELQINGQLGSETGRSVGATSGRVVLAEKVSSPTAMKRVFHNLTFYQEGEYASGGGSATGDAATYDQLFPTTHGKWGQLDYQGWRNMTEVRLGGSFEPATKWLVGLDYYSFGLASPHDFWYRSNGAPMFSAAMQDRTKDYGVHTGQEVDAAATWKVSRHVNWQAAVAEFLPGDFVKRVTGRSDPSTFLFAQGTYTY